MDEVRTVELLSHRWNSAYWHLLWFFLVPLLYVCGKYLHQLLNRSEDQPWIDSGVELHSDASSLFRGISMLAVKSSHAGKHKPSLEYPKRVAEIMNHYEAPWAIAGGWAIDMHLGRMTRPHEDIEVAVLRRDQGMLWTYLAGCHPQVVVPGSAERRPWERADVLELPVHEIHTRAPQAGVAELEFLLNETSDIDWVYRRDSRVRLPLACAILSSADGVPYLAPEVVLLYKSKEPRECDELDFEHVVGTLSPHQRKWLNDALRLTAPEHPWLSVLMDKDTEA